ncbi:CPBP family intramembrane glutamic endopeptidase [Microbacterium sp. P5_E9]
MPDHSTDAPTAKPTAEGLAESEAEATVGTRRNARRGAPDAEPPSGTHTRRTDWRLGGRTVARWREGTLAVAIVALGVAVLAGTTVVAFIPYAWSGMLGTALLWAGMLAGIIWAFTRSRPVGLLRFEPSDLVFGLGLGVLLRIVQGWLELTAGASGALPSYSTIGTDLPSGFWFTDVLSPVVIAPLTEEFFFRAVVLVCVYTILRRSFGKATAGLAAAVVSTALFLMLHSLTLSLTVDQVISLSLLGLVCSALVLLSGRIWGTVLIHVVYNATYVALALAGTMLN